MSEAPLRGRDISQSLSLGSWQRRKGSQFMWRFLTQQQRSFSLLRLVLVNMWEWEHQFQPRAEKIPLFFRVKNEFSYRASFFQSISRYPTVKCSMSGSWKKEIRGYFQGVTTLNLFLDEIKLGSQEDFLLKVLTRNHVSPDAGSNANEPLWDRGKKSFSKQGVVNLKQQKTQKLRAPKKCCSLSLVTRIKMVPISLSSSSSLFCPTLKAPQSLEDD